MRGNTLNLIFGFIIGYALGQIINLNAIFSILIK
jgi:large-conductance mechanosensitive channel